MQTNGICMRIFVQVCNFIAINSIHLRTCGHPVACVDLAYARCQNGALTNTGFVRNIDLVHSLLKQYAVCFS